MSHSPTRRISLDGNGSQPAGSGPKGRREWMGRGTACGAGSWFAHNE